MKLSIVLFDGYSGLDVVGAYEVLQNVPDVEVEFAARMQGVIAADSRRLGLAAYRALDHVDATDILCVPGGLGVSRALVDAHLLDHLRRLHETTTWTFGICNGVALLAAAGVLDGAEVTTNWDWRDRVHNYGVEVVNNRYHRSGKIVTGAGVSASIDAALFLAALIAGEDTARLIQLGLEYYPRPPFDGGDVDDVAEDARHLVRDITRAREQELGTLDAPFIAIA
jgi:putative intracellular protease/amidase